MFKLTNKLNY